MNQPEASDVPGGDDGVCVGTILYATMTGHSRKIAKTVAEETGLPVVGIGGEPRGISCDVLFIVSGIYGGRSEPALLEFVRKLDAARVGRAVLLTSSMNQMKADELRQALTETGISVDPDEYICRGAFLFVGMPHPSHADRMNAAAFAQRKLAE